MSLLTLPNQTEQTPLEAHIYNTREGLAKFLEYTLSRWEMQFNALWKHPDFTAQEQLDALGADAAQLFELNTKFVEFLLPLCTEHRPDLAERMTDLLSVIPDYVENEDGTITLVPVPEPDNSGVTPLSPLPDNDPDVA